MKNGENNSLTYPQNVDKLKTDISVKKKSWHNILGVAK